MINFKAIMLSFLLAVPQLVLANEPHPTRLQESKLEVGEEAVLVTVVMVGLVLTITLTTGVGLTLYALSDEEE